MPDGAGAGAGGCVLTVTMMLSCEDAVAPLLSVTCAVMTWVPADGVQASELPVPRAPSMLDDQLIRELMVPSCLSVAVPVAVTETPCWKLAFASGPVMLTVGAVFAVTVP